MEFYIEYAAIFVKFMNKRIFIFKEIKFVGAFNAATTRGVLGRPFHV